jgi:hypothetical protein
MDMALMMLAALYFLPFMVAAGRGSPVTIPILLFNAALGWTGIGWLAAMAAAIFGPSGEL